MASASTADQDADQDMQEADGQASAGMAIERLQILHIRTHLVTRSRRCVVDLLSCTSRCRVKC